MEHDKPEPRKRAFPPQLSEQDLAKVDQALGELTKNPKFAKPRSEFVKRKALGDVLSKHADWIASALGQGWTAGDIAAGIREHGVKVSDSSVRLFIRRHIKRGKARPAKRPILSPAAPTGGKPSAADRFNDPNKL